MTMSVGLKPAQCFELVLSWFSAGFELLAQHLLCKGDGRPVRE